jgi:hypothetical protein
VDIASRVMSAPIVGDEQPKTIVDVGPGLCQLPRTP